MDKFVPKEPVEVFSLAEILGDELEMRGWNSMSVAARMPGDFARNTLIVDLILAVQGQPQYNMAIDDVTYDGLDAAFSVSRGYFKRINEGWERWPGKRSKYDAPEKFLSGFGLPLQPPEEGRR